MAEQPLTLRPTGRDWAIMLAIGGVGLITHLLTNGNYGIFRDELYYLECARHLDWGYVDHPPLSMLLLRISVVLFGDSVWAIRLLPALAGLGIVVLTGLLALRLGGDRWAVLLASLFALCVPVYLVNTGFYSMNALDPLLWAFLFLLLAQLSVTGNRKLWLPFGVVLGLALQNKIGVAALAVGLMPALLVTGHGSQLKSRHFWLGVLVSALIFLPHVIWQVVHGWPTAEFIRNATAGKIVELSLVEFFLAQILQMNPGLLLVWLLGLTGLLFWKPLRPYRLLGVLWIAVFLFFGLQVSKAYYLAPAYTPLFAAGACMIAHAFRRRLTWFKPVIVVLTLGGGLFIAPLSFPLLSPEKLVRYMDATGIHPAAEETSGQAVLPQYLADRFGWENLTATVAQVYHALPDTLREECVIVGSNYGEAGAINYFGPEYGLPRAISQHNAFFMWGPGDASCEVILAIDYSETGLRQVYDSVSVATIVVSEWAMPSETNVYVHLCSGLKVPLAEAWEGGKVYD